MSRPTPLRVAPWPDDAGNPYQRLFYEALEPYGVTVTKGLSINDQVLDNLAPDIDVVHLHWPEYAWRVNGQGFTRHMRLIVGLWRFLGHARRLGLGVWWTVHNLQPHEGHWLTNYLGYRAVAERTDLAIAHSPFAAREAQRRYGLRRVVVMPIGNFQDMYPAPRPRDVVLAELGLDVRKPTVACVGAVRGYKGIDTALEALKRLDGAVQLIVAGDPKPDAGADRLQALAADAPWLRLIFRRLSDQEFCDFSAASDATLLPYKRATTSAVLLASWTFGRGVIASDLPCFADELKDHPGAGELVPPNNPERLADAIVRYLAVPEERRRAAALHASAEHEWSRCILPVVDALDPATPYRTVVSPAAPPVTEVTRVSETQTRGTSRILGRRF